MSSWSLKSPSNRFFNLHLANHQNSPLQGLWWPVDPHTGPVMRKCYHVSELREMFIACMHFTQPKFHQHHQHRKRLSPQLLIFRLLMSSMLSSLLLSMWISNTATATMMIPIVEAVLQQLKRHMVPVPKEGERWIDGHDTLCREWRVHCNTYSSTHLKKHSINTYVNVFCISICCTFNFNECIHLTLVWCGVYHMNSPKSRCVCCGTFH